MGVTRELCVSARAALPDSVEVVEIESDDAWMRDVGPTFVDRRPRQPARRGLDVQRVGRPLRLVGRRRRGRGASRSTHEGDPCHRAPLVLEGGSIDVDGEGTVLTTEECLLNPNRNPTLTRREIERAPVRPPRRRADRVARRGRRRRRDVRPRRQPRVLRPTGRGRPHVDRRHDRPAARGVARREAPLGRGGRRGPPASVAWAAAHDRRRGRRHRRGGRHEAALGGRPPRRLVRQLLHREPRGRSCRCSTRATTTRRSPPSQSLFPDREVVGSARTRDPARWRQHPLHHATGAEPYPEIVNSRPVLSVIQKACGPDRAQNVSDMVDLVVGCDRRGCRHRAPARAVPGAVLLPDRASGLVRVGVPGRRRPRRRRDLEVDEGSGNRGAGLVLRAGRAGALQLGRDRRGRRGARRLPQVAHPRRARATRRSSTSTPATRASRRGRRDTARSASASAGTSGSPNRRA